MPDIITDTKYRSAVDKETEGFTSFQERRPRVGEKRVFVYGAYKAPADYIAHRFHVVNVVREATDYDYEGERMYHVQAADGWEGSAWASELFPLPRGSR